MNQHAKYLGQNHLAQGSMVIYLLFIKVKWGMVEVGTG